MKLPAQMMPEAHGDSIARTVSLLQEVTLICVNRSAPTGKAAHCSTAHAAYRMPQPAAMREEVRGYGTEVSCSATVIQPPPNAL